jgi:DNA-binding CsgD family transcriptional regulator
MTDTVIIERDTLRAIGLKHILTGMFDLRPIIVSDLHELDNLNVDASALYFVDVNDFVSALDYFLPRRQFVVLLAHDQGRDDIPTIDMTASESTIIDTIGEILHHHEEIAEPVRGSLSQREIDVLRLVALGYINKEIADELSISLNTVLSHRKNITAKLGIRSASGFSFYAIMNGLIDPSTPRR